jgi:hypothetical protein
MEEFEGKIKNEIETFRPSGELVALREGELRLARIRKYFILFMDMIIC